MTANELDVMTREMRKHHAKISSRTDIEDFAYYLIYGLKAIGRDELANELDSLYQEIENVDTGELVKIGTFRR